MAEMHENAIEFLTGQKTATLTIHSARLKNRIEKLACDRSDECKVLHRNDDGTILAKIPVKWIKINPTRQMSEEQAKVLRTRLSEARASQEPQ